MWAASGLGAVIGALFASAWLERRSMTVVYAAAIALMGDRRHRRGRLAERLGRASGASLIGGIGNATAIVCNSLLVQRGAPDHVRGRVFTVIMGSNFAVLGIGMALTGPLVDARRAALGLRDRRRRSPSSHRHRLRRCCAGSRGRSPSRALVVNPRRELDTRDARRRGSGGRPAGARAGDHARRETPTRSPATSSTTSTRRPGRRTSIGVTGPPGVGKSSLIGALLAPRPRASSRPSASSRSIRRARSRRARCSATGSASPTTSSTRASSSARWARAAISAGSPRRRSSRC